MKKEDCKFVSLAHSRFIISISNFEIIQQIIWLTLAISTWEAPFVLTVIIDGRR